MCALACVCALTLFVPLTELDRSVANGLILLRRPLRCISRRVATVRNAGPIRPAHSVLTASPPNPVAPEPFSTHPLDLSLMDRWLATKIIAIWVTARKERCESLTANQMLLFDSEEPEKTKEILV